MPIIGDGKGFRAAERLVGNTLTSLRGKEIELMMIDIFCSRIEDQHGIVRQSISCIRFLTIFLDYVMQLVVDCDGMSCGHNHTLRLRIVDVMEIPGDKKGHKHHVALHCFLGNNDETKDGLKKMDTAHYDRNKSKVQTLNDAESIIEQVNVGQSFKSPPQSSAGQHAITDGAAQEVMMSGFEVTTEVKKRVVMNEANQWYIEYCEMPDQYSCLSAMLKMNAYGTVHLQHPIDNKPQLMKSFAGECYEVEEGPYYSKCAFGRAAWSSSFKQEESSILMSLNTGDLVYIMEGPLEFKDACYGFIFPCLEGDVQPS